MSPEAWGAIAGRSVEPIALDIPSERMAVAAIAQVNANVSCDLRQRPLVGDDSRSHGLNAIDLICGPRKIEVVRQGRIAPVLDSVSMTDHAGYWVEISPSRQFNSHYDGRQ